MLRKRVLRTLYLLIIGVSKYPEEWKLDLAEKDAQ
jgi:hypothetical protein